MIAKNLKHLRAKAQVQQRALACRYGMHNPTLCDIELGRIGIDTRTYKDLVECIDEMAAEKAAMMRGPEGPGEEYGDA